MSDLDRYLYEQLQSQAAGGKVPAGDIGAVKARGHRRRQRRAGAGILAALTAAGTVSGVVVWSSSGGRHGQITVGSPTGLSAAPGDQLTWRVAPATEGLSDLTSLSSAGSVAYAVSTAPGVVAAGGDPGQQLYRSADGLSWTTATGPAGLSTADVAVDGNRVYTVGTGPATAATGDSGAMTTDVSWTDNDGGSWQNSVLPVDLSAPASTVTNTGENVNVAAGPKGVVATVSIGATVDLSKFVSGVSATTLWTTNSSGVEVLGSQVSAQCGFSAVDQSGVTLAQGAASQQKVIAAYRKAGGTATAKTLSQLSAAGMVVKTPPAPEGQITSVPCADASGQVTRYIPADQAYRVVKTYSWSQLNIGGQWIQVLQGEPLVFFSTDGTHFEPASLPAGTSGAANVTAGPAGFAMEVPGADGPPAILQSADGQHWISAPFGLPAEVTGASGIGYVDGHLVVIGETQTSSAAYTLLSDGWQATTLSGNVGAASFGPLGVAVIGVSGSGGTWQVQFSQDGLQWSSAASLSSLSAGSVDDANVVVGANQVVITVTRPPTGQPSNGPADQAQVVGTPAT